MIPALIQPVPPEFALFRQMAREEHARQIQEHRLALREQVAADARMLADATREYRSRVVAEAKVMAERFSRETAELNRDAMIRAARLAGPRIDAPTISDENRRTMTELARAFRGQSSLARVPAPDRHGDASPHATHVVLAHPTR